MKHLELFKVKFTSAIPRQKVTDGVVVHYFRNNFEIAGQMYSVQSPKDLSGLQGEVRFVKAGEPLPDGNGVVARDAFSIAGITSLESLRTALELVRLKRDIDAFEKAGN